MVDVGRLKENLVATALKYRNVALAYAAFKLLCNASVWISGQVSESLLRQAFVERVYQNRESPPSLKTMAVGFCFSNACLQGFSLVLIAMVLYIASVDIEDVVLFIALAYVDIVIGTAFVAIVLWTITKQIGEKNYFNYEKEGLRAIRATRKIASGVAYAAATTPTSATVAALFGLEALKSSISQALERQTRRSN